MSERASRTLAHRTTILVGMRNAPEMKVDMSNGGDGKDAAALSRAENTKRQHYHDGGPEKKPQMDLQPTEESKGSFAAQVRKPCTSCERIR